MEHLELRAQDRLRIGRLAGMTLSLPTTTAIRPGQCCISLLRGRIGASGPVLLYGRGRTRPHHCPAACRRPGRLAGGKESKTCFGSHGRNAQRPYHNRSLSDLVKHIWWRAADRACTRKCTTEAVNSWTGRILPFAPISSGICAKVAALGAPHTRAERRHQDGVSYPSTLISVW